MVSIRINYLHVQLLLRLALVQRVSEPNIELVTVAADMLSLTVEAIVLKHHMVNSGTGLVWRVSIE